jgi:hypothetical protein
MLELIERGFDRDRDKCLELAALRRCCFCWQSSADERGFFVF